MKEYDENKKNPNIEEQDKRETSNILFSDTDFMREKIKQRPVNKRKLLHSTVITVVLAIVFGVVACLTFFLLVPAFNSILNPEPEPTPEVISLPVHQVEDEILPEELISGNEKPSTGSSEIPQAEVDVIMDIAAYPFGTDEYTKMFTAMKKVAESAANGLVTVTLVTNSTDWFNAQLEVSGSRSGAVIADNGYQLLILTILDEVLTTQEIEITFFDGVVKEGTLYSSDSETGLSVIAVKHSLFKDDELENYSPVRLANSSSRLIVAQPCIATGFAAGTQGSMVFGMVTANNRTISMPDADYTLVSTNMSAVPSGSGVLLNMRGEVLGLFCPSLTKLTAQESGSQITAYGISSVRSLVESLSNAQGRTYFGVYGADVPASVREEQNMPAGAYISRVEMDTPAMDAGLQPGDIIIKIDETEIVSYTGLSTALLTMVRPGTQARITVMRQGPDGYGELELQVNFRD